MLAVSAKLVAPVACSGGLRAWRIERADGGATQGSEAATLQVRRAYRSREEGWPGSCGDGPPRASGGLGAVVARFVCRGGRVSHVEEKENEANQYP